MGVDQAEAVVRLSAPVPRDDAVDCRCSAQGPPVRRVRRTAVGARQRVLLIEQPVDPVRVSAVGGLHHQRRGIKEALKLLKNRMHLEAVSGLSLLALLLDMAANLAIARKRLPIRLTWKCARSSGGCG